MLAVSASAFVFMALLLAHAGGGITEKEESRIYALSCVLVPLGGVLASWGVDRAKRRFFATQPLFYPLLAAANAVFWAYAVNQLRDALPPPATGAEIDLRPLLRHLLADYGIGNVVLVAFLAVTRKRFESASAIAVVSRWVDRALPVVVFAALLPFAARTPQPRGLIVVLAIAGAASFFHEELARFPRRRSARYALDALVIAAVVLLVFDPAGDVDVHHHNFYLGPTAAVRAGKSLLVDVNCQYGVGVIYFIGAVFDLGLVPPTLGGFATLICALSIIEYLLIYLTLRATTRSAALSAVVLAVMVIVPVFGQINYPTDYPSSGAIRFLPGFVLVACFALRGRFPRHGQRIFLLEGFVVGAASIWSLESFVYVLVAYLGSLVYEAAHCKRSEVVAYVQARAGSAVVMVAAWHLALALITYARSGEWPHWSRYFDYIRLYSVQEYGTLPVEPWTPWLLIAGAYIVSIVALGYRRITLGRSDLKWEYAVVFGMSALGVAQFTYYVGRSHSNNLFHVCLPALFVAAFWFIQAARRTRAASDAFRRSFVFVCWGALALVFFSALNDLTHKLDHSLLSFVVSGRPLAHLEPSKRASDAAELMARHAPAARRVAFFSNADVQVQTFLLAKKASLWPEGYLVEDNLLEANKRRIFEFRDGLAPGDVIFVDTGTARPAVAAHVDLVGDTDAVTRQLWNGVAGHFGFEVLDSRPTGTVALRLIAR